MASAYFGSRCTAGELAARYATSLGGPAEARILGTLFRAPVAYTALANGTAGHADEIDGAHVTGGHPGATIVHARSASRNASAPPPPTCSKRSCWAMTSAPG